MFYISLKGADDITLSSTLENSVGTIRLFLLRVFKPVLLILSFQPLFLFFLCLADGYIFYVFILLLNSICSAPLHFRMRHLNIRNPWCLCFNVYTNIAENDILVSLTLFDYIINYRGDFLKTNFFNIITFWWVGWFSK